MAVGTPGRPGAAQGPHGEEDGDATGAGCREDRGPRGQERRPTTGAGDVRPNGRLSFWWFGGREEGAARFARPPPADVETNWTL